jgi:SAM-dependent methyltransferase
VVRAFQGPQAADAVEAAPPRSGENVLDVACGTGIAVRLVLPRVAPRGQVTGLDIDPAMIEVARALAGDPRGVTLDWHCASALTMPFENATFDLVFCLQGLQFLRDCSSGLAEMRRVMKPDARLVAVVRDAIEHCKGQYAVVRMLVDRKVDPTPMLKANALGDAGKLRAHAIGAGFNDVHIRVASGAARYASTQQFIDAFLRPRPHPAPRSEGESVRPGDDRRAAPSRIHVEPGNALSDIARTRTFRVADLQRRSGRREVTQVLSGNGEGPAYAGRSPEQDSGAGRRATGRLGRNIGDRAPFSVLYAIEPPSRFARSRGHWSLLYCSYSWAAFPVSWNPDVPFMTPFPLCRARS